MNKKGFTLVELLAVIVILAVVMLIGSVSLTGVRDKMNKNMFEAKLDLVIGAAKSWGQDNKNALSSRRSVKVLRENASGSITSTTILSYGVSMSINDLINSTYLETEETSSDYSCGAATCKVVINNYNSKIVNDLNIFIYLEHNRVYACIIPSDANKTLLGEKNDYSEYYDLNYYCRG